MNDKVNEIKISYHEKQGVINTEPLNNSETTAKYLYQNWDMDTIGLHETFKVLLLNSSNKPKGTYHMSTGGLVGTVVDVRMLYAVVLKTLSPGIILAHNHPSGNPRPSTADIEITEKIRRAGELFDIRVLDHIILMPDGSYYSFTDNGEL